MRAVVLAAGKGKRLHSEEFELPKAMREACGKPLLEYVLDSLSFIDKDGIVIVVGYMKEAIMERFGEYTFAFQDKQLGTGHAAMCAKDALAGYDGPVLVCYGDMPLMTKDTYMSAIEKHINDKNDCTVITGIAEKPLAYGRIIRDEKGDFLKVVEDKDCTPEQKAITELNIGVYVFDSVKLFNVLGELKNNNAQNEYYLTDAPAIMMEKGFKIGTFTITDSRQMYGVNTLEDLEFCENLLKERNCK